LPQRHSATVPRPGSMTSPSGVRSVKVPRSSSGPFSYGITVAPVLDIRNGFPISVIDEDRNFVGSRNRAGRFPDFASLDLQVLKSVSAPGRFSGNYRFRVGVKVFNLTNHFNPRDFQNNLAASDFEHFYNSVGRTLRGKFIFEF